MKISYIPIIILSFLSVNVFAQLDKGKGTTDKGKKKLLVLGNAKVVSKPKSIELNGLNGFEKAYQQEQQKLNKQQKEARENNKDILTQAKLQEQRFQKNFKRINGQYVYPVIDQDLGSFRTSSRSVNIICRDYQYPDGDRVTIFVNDIPVVYNLTLEQRYQKFNIPLDVGVNRIVIQALNQGTSGPNTAAFKVYNDAGELISSNEWNLATGAKATMVIAKDK